MEVSVYRPGVPTRRLRVASPAVIGRASGCDILLGDPSVEPRHVRLTVDPRGILLEKLGGTVVHRKLSLLGSTILDDHDEIVVGRFVISICREPDELVVVRVDEPTGQDAELLAALAADPGDRAMRDVYADTLEGRGDHASAAFVRDGILDPALLERTSIAWRTTTSRDHIVYCDVYTCPRRWDALAATRDPACRRCGLCGARVAYCSWVAEAAACGLDDRQFVLDPMVRRDHAIEAYLAAPRQPPRPAARASELPLVVRPKIPRTFLDLETALQIRLPDETSAVLGYISAGRDSGDIVPLSPLVYWLDAKCHCDFHHHGPGDTLARGRTQPLASYRVALAPDPELESAFRRRLGDPALVLHEGRTLRRFGQFFIDEAGASLEWYERIPGWAIPLDEGAREAFLVELIATIARAETHAMLVRVFPHPPATAGIEISGPLNPDDYGFRFNPPINAARLAAAFGWTEVRAFSSDMHASRWHLQSRGERPVCGIWRVDTFLTERPKGTSENYMRYELVAEDHVASMNLVAARARRSD